MRDRLALTEKCEFIGGKADPPLAAHLTRVAHDVELYAIT